VPGLFSGGEDPVHGPRGFQWVHVLSGDVLYRRGAGEV